MQTPPNAFHLGIGQLSKATGRSVYTIRWYESQGLMPGVQRDAGGRRVYSERHVGWLSLMVRLRASGMSIAQMRRYAALTGHGKLALTQRRELLLAHRLDVLARIEEWQTALGLLDAKIGFYGEWLAQGKRPVWLDDGTPTAYSAPR